MIEIETREDKEKNKYLDYSKDCIDLGKNLKITITDFKGNILDISYCTNPIIVMKYIGDAEGIDINTSIEFAEQGIDLFDSQDAFFNERCCKFKGDKDIILEDRRNDIFQNVNFCGYECLYNGMDYSLMIAKCICDGANIQEQDENLDNLDESKKGITLNDLANPFKSEIFSFNLDVVKCYNLVFDLNILKRNKGFFVNIVKIGLQIVFLIFFRLRD